MKTYMERIVSKIDCAAKGDLERIRRANELFVIDITNAEIFLDKIISKL